MTLYVEGEVLGHRTTPEKDRDGKPFNKMIIGVGYTDQNEFGRNTERYHQVRVGSNAQDLAQKFVNVTTGKRVRMPVFVGSGGDLYVSERQFDSIEVI